MPLGTIRLGIHRGIHLQKTQARFVPSTVGASLVQTFSVGFVFRQAAVYNPAEKRPRSDCHGQPRFTGYPKLYAEDFSSQVLHEPPVSLLIRIHFCTRDHSTQLCLIPRPAHLRRRSISFIAAKSIKRKSERDMARALLSFFSAGPSSLEAYQRQTFSRFHPSQRSSSQSS